MTGLYLHVCVCAKALIGRSLFVVYIIILFESFISNPVFS